MPNIVVLVPKYKSVIVKDKGIVGDDSRSMKDVLREAHKSLSKHKYNLFLQLSSSVRMTEEIEYEGTTVDWDCGAFFE